MRNASPLRYPGGKGVMADLLAQIRRINGVGNTSICEPFTGGAGASLNLLFSELAPSVILNDADQSVFAFWWSVTKRSAAFLDLLASRRVSMAEWRRQRDVYRARSASRLQRGFATFYLNRCNRSGIVMNGGPIGGIEQDGEWKLGARYNKTELAVRCRRVFEYRERIRVSRLDGIAAIEKAARESAFQFIDPPYFEKGQTLYLNALTTEYHAELAETLRHHRQGIPWVLTYDDCPQIRKLYGGWATLKPFRLRYVASQRRNGNELLIVPRGTMLPKNQASRAIAWAA